MTLTIGNTYRKNFEEKQENKEEKTPITITAEPNTSKTTVFITAIPTITATGKNSIKSAEKRTKANFTIQSMITPVAIRNSLKPKIKPELKKEEPVVETMRIKSFQ